MMRRGILLTPAFTLTAFVLAVLAMLVNPAPAAAHAVLLDTTPGSWQLLDNSPHAVTMRFNEPIDVDLAEVRLIGPRGDDIAGIPRPAHPGGRSNEISVAISNSLANGTHTVAYRVVSADSHPVQGAFTFSVGEPTSTAAPAQFAGADSGNAVVATIYGTLRWLSFGGLALLVGTAYFITACWPGGATRPGVRRLLRVGWAGLVAATLGTLLLYGPYAAGRPFGELVNPRLVATTLGSRMGLMILLRLLLLGLMLAATLPVAQRLRKPGAVLGAGAALAVTWSLANHSAVGDQVAIAVSADIAHLLAMGVWIGGLPVLLGVLLRSGDVQGMRDAIPRFSRAALISVAVLVATGVFQAWRAVGTPSALFGTAYGTTLIVKLSLVIVLVGLGGLARKWVQRHYNFPIENVIDKRRARRGPGDDEVRRFRRSIAVEAALAIVVLGVTASLVSVEPARAELAREAETLKVPAFTGPVNKVVQFDAGGGATGRGLVAVEVTPGKIGPNEVHVTVLDAAKAPKNVPEVRAELTLPDRSLGPISVPLEFGGPGHYIGTNATLSMPGQWQLTLTVRTSEVDQATVRIPVGAR